MTRATLNRRAEFRRTLWLMVGALLPIVLTGCSTCSSCNWCCKKWHEPAAAPSQVSVVMSYWDNRVRYAHDTVNQGTQMPGLAGRVLLFGEDQSNALGLEADGIIEVDLFDLTQNASGAAPPMLERWQFDPQTLKRLKRTDAFGDGYTLFLPWSTYRPDITQVKMQVRYIPTTGSPHYADPMTLSLRSDTPPQVTNRQILPTQHQVPNRGGATPSAK